MADYWLKLYIEILDDPKMATLPDRLWRRVVELFLFAKEYHQDGHLPDARQIAWRLRMNADDLELDLGQIAQTGIIERELNGWFVPKFATRQAAVSGAERVQQFRKRQQQQEYYGDVTQEKRIVTQINRLTETDTETDTENNNAAVAVVSTAYEQNIGMLTPILADTIKDLCDEYPQEWVTDAINIAVRAEKRNMRYVQGVLRNRKQGGFNSNGGGKPAALSVEDQIRAITGNAKHE